MIKTEIERKREKETDRQTVPGAIGMLRPQNSTVSFKNEVGTQWYTLNCSFGSSDVRSL